VSRNRRNKNVGGADSVEVTKVTKFVTDAEANAALADVAKVVSMADRREADAKKKAPKALKALKDGRVKLPPLPRGANKQKPLVPCGCGCGSQTRSKFAPGHDSRLRGWALRVARNMVKLDEIVTVYKCSEGERNAVEAHIKQLKKDGLWEALKDPQAPAKKTATAE